MARGQSEILIREAGASTKKNEELENFGILKSEAVARELGHGLSFRVLLAEIPEFGLAAVYAPKYTGPMERRLELLQQLSDWKLPAYHMQGMVSLPDNSQAVFGEVLDVASENDSFSEKTRLAKVMDKYVRKLLAQGFLPRDLRTDAWGKDDRGQYLIFDPDLESIRTPDMDSGGPTPMMDTVRRVVLLPYVQPKSSALGKSFMTENSYKITTHEMSESNELIIENALKIYMLTGEDEWQTLLSSSQSKVQIAKLVKAKLKEDLTNKQLIASWDSLDTESRANVLELLSSRLIGRFDRFGLEQYTASLETIHAMCAGETKLETIIAGKDIEISSIPMSRLIDAKTVRWPKKILAALDNQELLKIVFEDNRLSELIELLQETVFDFSVYQTNRTDITGQGNQLYFLPLKYPKIFRGVFFDDYRKKIMKMLEEGEAHYAVVAAAMGSSIDNYPEMLAIIKQRHEASIWAKTTSFESFSLSLRQRERMEMSSFEMKLVEMEEKTN